MRTSRKQYCLRSFLPPDRCCRSVYAVTWWPGVRWATHTWTFNNRPMVSVTNITYKNFYSIRWSVAPFVMCESVWKIFALNTCVSFCGAMVAILVKLKKKFLFYVCNWAALSVSWLPKRRAATTATHTHAFLCFICFCRRQRSLAHVYNANQFDYVVNTAIRYVYGYFVYELRLYASLLIMASSCHGPAATYNFFFFFVNNHFRRVYAFT